MDKKQAGAPFRPLGRRLKELRSRARETLAEASGAVEIDIRQLANFELGNSRPSEDVLLLLLSHFGAKDDEALKLWELAGYNMDKIPVVHMGTDEQSATRRNFSDSQILFTDIVDVVVNNYGVVMNFMQNRGPKAQPVQVAKVGMSREHAKSILQILQATLAQTERNTSTKRLATPDTTSQEN